MAKKTRASDRWAADEEDGFVPFSIKPQCWNCKHYEQGTMLCAAFPAGIPNDIYINNFVHDKPYLNDRGIRYESRDDA